MAEMTMFLTSMLLAGAPPEGASAALPAPPTAPLTPFRRCPETVGVESPAAPRPARPAWAGPGALGTACALLAVSLLAYLPALRGAFLWDDDAHVTKPPLRSLHGLWRIWFEPGATQQYYPLLHSAFWAKHRLWGDSALGYHLANVALHAG